MLPLPVWANAISQNHRVTVIAVPALAFVAFCCDSKCSCSNRLSSVLVSEQEERDGDCGKKKEKAHVGNKEEIQRQNEKDSFM